MDHQWKNVFPKLSTSSVSANDLRAPSTTNFGDEEIAADADDPPDDHQLFRRQAIRSPTFPGTLSPASLSYIDAKPRQQSLLTEGLLNLAASKRPSNEHLPPPPRSATSFYSTSSITSTAELTSDGGLTSPARTSTPSPPLPPTNLNVFGLSYSRKAEADPFSNTSLNPAASVQQPAAEPPRKRCITFACSRPADPKAEVPPKAPETIQNKIGQRPTTLKFACPARPAREAAAERNDRPIDVNKGERQAVTKKIEDKARTTDSPNSQETPQMTETSKILSPSSPALSKKKNKLRSSSFHEFASSHIHDDEWIQEEPVRQHKLTVNDTLMKENAIRKLGEEAEAEAEEEEKEDEEDDNAEFAMGNRDFDDEFDVAADNDDDDDFFSDDGNETDDEEGFAASEDEEGSEYQFWTPGVTTAATSTDHLDHIRPNYKRTASESSIESAILTRPLNINKQSPLPIRKPNRRREGPQLRPSTPELPDSTDFVCGTLDEDRPLEAAYMSCLEQRKRSKHGITPQDVDPSFPTSDPEQEDSDDENNGKSLSSNRYARTTTKLDTAEDSCWQGRRSRTCLRSPSISPKRRVSPTPRRGKSPAPLLKKRGNVCLSPPPRKLFGQSTPKRVRSPAPQKLFSPPSTRRPSYSEKNVSISNLAQRPHLTHTKSLPRTPNPFWREHRRLQMKEASKQKQSDNETPDAESRSRGPIDIVQGLEKKRHRRKEKFWLTHYRHPGKEKDRRCQPGKGAERMREVGLEMADRCKGYGQRLQLVLSV